MLAQSPSRLVLPELLDDLPAGDARAIRSRRDLRRVHRAMRSVTILRRAIGKLQLANPPRRILELGGGDGTLMLRLARALAPRWTQVELTLLDQQELVSEQTRQSYLDIGWNIRVLRGDVNIWSNVSHADNHYNLCVTSLFLHHFDDAHLERLLAAIAVRSDSFVACEPRRDPFARAGSYCVGLLGANQVTREDAVTSVAAGFRGRELTDLWNHVGGDWIVDEYRALPFTHCFTATRGVAAPSGKSSGD